MPRSTAVATSAAPGILTPSRTHRRRALDRLDRLDGPEPREANPSPPARRTQPTAWLRIEEELAARIERGTIPAGDRLPGEREIGDEFGVSRMTVRQALARLEQRGLVVRRRSVGTFVAEPRFRQSATVLRGFFDELAAQGTIAVSKLLSVEESVPSPSIAIALDLQPGETVYTVTRVRSASSVPIVIERSHFPASIVPGLPREDLEHGSIYRLMERRYDARPVRASQSFEAVAADAHEAQTLAVAIGSPLMRVERTSWDARGRAVEQAQDLHRADRSRFVTELRL
ncbi:MAG TPA: GntR family transcriptional regulator [Candidatus Limnocylindrales bacterium]|nr:GntR family transcriptional regulator [Candidatus Limnocylindrales bacterium]